MARRFQDQVNIQQQSLSTGFGQGANTLLNRLQQFKGATERLVDVTETQRGAREAQGVELIKTDVEGFNVTAKPQKKEAGFLEQIISGGAATAQFNKSVQASYLASLGNDTREAIAAIELDNSDNIGQFNDKVAGYASGVLQGVDPAARQQVSQFIDNQISDSRIRVHGRTIKRQQAIADVERSRAIEGATDAAIRASREGNQVAAGEALLETKRIMDSFVGQPGVDQAGVNFAFEQIQKKVAVESIRAGVRSEAAKPGGVGSVAKIVREFREKQLKGFSVEEQEGIYSTLVTDLNQVIALRNKEEDAENDLVIASQKTKSEALYLGVIGGESTAGDVTTSLASKEINQQQASTLINLINNRGAGVDDWTLINSIEEDIRSGIDADQIRGQIATNTGARLTNETGRSLLAKLNEFQDRESVLKTSVAQRAEDFIIASMRVTGPLGSLDSEAERRLALAKREYSNRVLAGEDPFAVADGLVDIDAFTRAPRPQFGNKDDLDASLTGLNSAMEAGTIDDETYNREWQSIENLKQLKANIEAFNKAKKDHENGIK